MAISASKGDLGRASVGRSSPRRLFHLQDQPRVQQKFKDIKDWTFPGGYSSSLHPGRFPEQEVRFLIPGDLCMPPRLQHTYAAPQSIRSKSGCWKWKLSFIIFLIYQPHFRAHLQHVAITGTESGKILLTTTIGILCNLPQRLHQA